MFQEVEQLLDRYPVLMPCQTDIEAAIQKLLQTYMNGGKLLMCGNGGSCADCTHIVGELMKGFLRKRPLSKDEQLRMQKLCPELTDEMLGRLQKGLPAIALSDPSALTTDFSNDVDPSLIYAQQVLVLANKTDTLLCISTSGNSKNVVEAAKMAKGLGISEIGMTGVKAGKLGELADVTISVPAAETYQAQELHLPVYHAICAALEAHFYQS